MCTKDKEVFLHIGTHKTGTTSVQKYLFEHNELLNNHDAVYYSGGIIESNHVELHLFSMRDNRQSPYKYISKLSKSSEDVITSIGKIRDYLNHTDYKKCIFSAEGLSYLRYPDELRTMGSIFGGFHVNVIMVFRNKKEYLRSYAAQLKKMGIAVSDNRDSFAYIEEDSWLTDYDEIVKCYELEFGKENINILDYERELESIGSIIPSVLRIIDVPVSRKIYTNNYWENRSEL